MVNINDINNNVGGNDGNVDGNGNLNIDNLNINNLNNRGGERYNCPLTENQMSELSNFNSVDDLISYYYYAYPTEHYINYPEFTIRKLRLDNVLLNSLPSVNVRTRNDIKNWMRNMNITVNDWTYVGW